MLIGRNPGVTEDKEGSPFIGKAGQALDRFLVDAGLKRDEVYITNTGKCYGGIGDPCPTEEVFDVCEPFLEMEFLWVQPSLVITLGAEAYRRVSGNAGSILATQGTFETVHYGSWDGPKISFSVFPVSHPSFWLRSGTHYDYVIKVKIIPALREWLQEHGS
jgi:DNA polymerase